MIAWLIVIFMSFGSGQSAFANGGVFITEKECETVAEETLKKQEDKKVPYGALACIKVTPPGKDV